MHVSVGRDGLDIRYPAGIALQNSHHVHISAMVEYTMMKQKKNKPQNSPGSARVKSELGNHWPKREAAAKSVRQKISFNYP